MKKASKEIMVGKATKYKRVKFEVAKTIAAYKYGKPVSAIALAIGFPANCGQNRTRRVLEQEWQEWRKGLRGCGARSYYRKTRQAFRPAVHGPYHSRPAQECGS